MANTLIVVLLLIVALAIGIGIAMYLLPSLVPFIDEQTRIIIGVILSLFAFISLYFMSKASGSS